MPSSMHSTQADKRRNMTLTDQHGRQYFAVIEKASGFPTGLVQPLYDAPHPDLYPPQKYMRFPVDQPGKLMIDYAAWEGEATAGIAAWEQERIRTGSMIHGAAFDPHAPPTIQLVMMIGPKPMSPLPIKAMRQGNRWALGLSDVKPPEAEHFFPKPAVDPSASVFTETDPIVFAEELAVPMEGAATSLQDLLDDVKRRCPANLKGVARGSWVAAELTRMAAQEA